MRCQFAVVVIVFLSQQAVRADTLHVPKDHATIQAAVDAATSGDTVLVAPGTYRERVRLKTGVALKSAGADTKGKLGLARAEATILDLAGDNKGPGVLLADGTSLDGFTVTRVGIFDQKEYDEHYATQGENLADDRGAVGAGKGFSAVGLPGVTAIVRHCIVHNNGTPGIGCSGAKEKRNHSLIEHNIAYRNMGGGIGIADGASPTVRANRCWNNLRAGIGCRNAFGLIVDNECFDNVRAGIGIREGAKPTVRSNKCHDNRRAGIGCRMEGSAPIIENNDCYRNAMAGIGNRDKASPMIRGNRCYENLMAGIGTRAEATPTIVGNKCWKNKMAGIGSREKARPFIADNECYENDLAGIGQMEDAETTLIGNYIHHNKKAGVGFDECKTGKATLIKNKIIANELVAVGINPGWTVRLVGNELAREGGLPPLVMVFKNSEATFVNNTFRGSGVAGVRTEGVVRIFDNDFVCPTQRKGGGPPQFAVWGLPGARIEFVGNNVKGWRHALHADKAGVTASRNTVSDYWQVGIQINQPTEPAIAIGNVFETALDHAGVRVNGMAGLIDRNRVVKMLPK